MNTTTLPQELMRGALMHFESGVPIDDLTIRAEQKQRMARVEHVYWQFLRNPFLDAGALLRQLVRGKYKDAPSECHAAQKDKALFDFVVSRVAQQDRKVSEAQVRAVSRRLMQNGMATDNGRDMAEGAKLMIKLDRLDQPEDNTQDISKVTFLPSVVVTNVKEVDPDKDYIDDDETRRIAAKYGAYIPEQRSMIEKHVATMEAAAAETENQ